MFVAVVPPEPALEDLAEFLGPRQGADDGLRWTAPEQWHVTVAFMAAVPERSLDDLRERLARAAGRRTAFPVTLGGGGAFPDVTRAKVLFAGVDAGVELGRLAVGARAAATKAGAAPDGGRFHPHVTLARLRRPHDATRWLRVLDAYRGPRWLAEEVALVRSQLGQGPSRRPRHEVVDAFPLAPPVP